MELLQLVDVRVEEASRPLREEVVALKLLLARVGGSLEPAEACPFDGLGLAKAHASVALGSSEQMSSVIKEEHLYGCFSPHGPSSLPNESAAPEHGGMDMVVTRALDLELSADVDATVLLSPETNGRLVAKSGVLTPVHGAFVAKEICVFLATLGAAYPGCEVTSKSDGAKPNECRSKKRSATKKDICDRLMVACLCPCRVVGAVWVCRVLSVSSRRFVIFVLACVGAALLFMGGRCLGGVTLLL
jgi:hypothetical protein